MECDPMKKTVLALISATAVIGLSACADNEPAEEEVAAEGEGDVQVNLPQTPVVPATPAPEDGDRVSISEDGVSAEINDGNTSVTADMDGDPSLEVEVD